MGVQDRWKKKFKKKGIGKDSGKVVVKSGGSYKGKSVGGSYTSKAKKAGSVTPAKEKTQEAIKEEVAQAKEDYKKQETPEQQTLILELAQTQGTGSAKYKALVARSLAETKKKVKEPTETSAVIAGGRARVSGEVRPFKAQSHKSPEQASKFKQGQQEMLLQRQGYKTDIQEGKLVAAKDKRKTYIGREVEADLPAEAQYRGRFLHVVGSGIKTGAMSAAQEGTYGYSRYQQYKDIGRANLPRYQKAIRSTKDTYRKVDESTRWIPEATKKLPQLEKRGYAFADELRSDKYFPFKEVAFERQLGAGAVEYGAGSYEEFRKKPRTAIVIGGAAFVAERATFGLSRVASKVAKPVVKTVGKRVMRWGVKAGATTLHTAYIGSVVYRASKAERPAAEIGRITTGEVLPIAGGWYASKAVRQIAPKVPGYVAAKYKGYRTARAYGKHLKAKYKNKLTTYEEISGEVALTSSELSTEIVGQPATAVDIAEDTITYGGAKVKRSRGRIKLGKAQPIDVTQPPPKHYLIKGKTTMSGRAGFKLNIKSSENPGNLPLRTNELTSSPSRSFSSVRGGSSVVKRKTIVNLLGEKQTHISDVGGEFKLVEITPGKTGVSMEGYSISKSTARVPSSTQMRSVGTIHPYDPKVNTARDLAIRPGNKPSSPWTKEYNLNRINYQPALLPEQVPILQSQGNVGIFKVTNIKVKPTGGTRLRDIISVGQPSFKPIAAGALYQKAIRKARHSVWEQGVKEKKARQFETYQEKKPYIFENKEGDWYKNYMTRSEYQKAIRKKYAEPTGDIISGWQHYTQKKAGFLKEAKQKERKVRRAGFSEDNLILNYGSFIREREVFAQEKRKGFIWNTIKQAEITGKATKKKETAKFRPVEMGAGASTTILLKPETKQKAKQSIFLSQTKSKAKQKYKIFSEQQSKQYQKSEYVPTSKSYAGQRPTIKVQDVRMPTLRQGGGVFIASYSATASATKAALKSAQRQSQKQSQIQSQKASQLSIQSVGQVQLQKAAQTTALDLNLKQTTLTTTTKTTTRRTPDLKIPDPGTPPPPPPPMMPWRHSSKSSADAFNVLVKRKGEWQTLKKELPKGFALKAGSDYTRRTLGATFKIEPFGTTTKRDIHFRPNPTVFREYKISGGQKISTPNIFIQKRGKRLSKRTEVAEIMGYKMQKRTGGWKLAI